MSSSPLIRHKLTMVTPGKVTEQLSSTAKASSASDKQRDPKALRTILADAPSILRRLGIFDLMANIAAARHPASAIEKPEIVQTESQARPLPGQIPTVSDRVKMRDESRLQGKPLRPTHSQQERVGKKDSRTGRQIVQPLHSPVQNERLAAENAPKLETRLSEICARVPGAKFERLRPEKNLQRVKEKVKEGKPAETISDYSAAQISADSPEAKDRLILQIRREFPVISVEDRFLKGRPEKAGYPSANVQVKLPNGGTSEVQIVPREVQRITDQTHHLYKRGRNARDSGDHAAAQRAFSEASRMNHQAVKEFKERNRIQPPMPAAERRKQISKGQQVALTDGRQATVRYLSPTMDVARVRTADGKTRTVRLSQIVVEAPHLSRETKSQNNTGF